MVFAVGRFSVLDFTVVIYSVQEIIHFSQIFKFVAVLINVVACVCDYIFFSVFALFSLVELVRNLFQRFSFWIYVPFIELLSVSLCSVCLNSENM